MYLTSKHHSDETQTTPVGDLIALRAPVFPLNGHTSLVMVLLLSCFASHRADAQAPPPVVREQSDNSPLRRLDLLQQSVKRKLKSALGVNEPDGVNLDATKTGDPYTEASPARVDYSSRGPREAMVRNNPSNQPVNQYREQRNSFSTTDELVPLGQSTDRTTIEPFDPRQIPAGQVVAATEIDWHAGQHPVAANEFGQPTQRVEYRESYDPSMIPRVATNGMVIDRQQSYQYAQYPAPSPSHNVAPSQYTAQPSTWNNQAPTGDSVLNRAVGSENAPLARGAFLGDSQITATQHALRLMEENGDLKARLAMLDAENKRLKDKLVQTENLLSRSNEAVSAAYDEIEAMRTANGELQKKLTDSEQTHNRYLLETDRMLQSIREELDDVLVREISAKGN